MVSKYRIFFLIFIPAALVLVAGMALIQQKNTNLSAAQFEKLLKSQWELVAAFSQNSTHYTDINALKQPDGLRITLVDKNGQVFFDSQATGPFEPHKDREEIRNALADVPSMSIRYSRTTRNHTIYYARKLPDGNILRIAYPAEYYDEQKSALMGQAFIGLLTLMALVAGFAFLVSRKTSQTLSRLSLTVKEAQNGGIDLPTFNNEDLDTALYALSSATRELKQAHGENLELNRRLAYILDNINEGVLLLDSDKIIYHNQRAAHILNYKIPADVKDINQREMIGIFEAFISGPLTELRVDNKIISVDLTASGPSRLVILHDISDKEKYSGYKSDLIGNISHELKTPLTLIMAAAEVITKDAEMPKAFLEKFLNTIYKNSQRLNVLLDDLIFLHRLEGAGEMAPEPSGIEETIADIKSLITPQGKSIIYNYEPKRVNIHGTHLVSVLMNLINNALKYSTGQNIYVDLHQSGSALEIKVADEGPEIPPGERERVFERFYSLSKSRNREKSGSGLGLSIVKHIARLYNGQVTLTGNQYSGNTFTVRLVER